MFSRIPAAAVLTGAAGLIHMAAAVAHVGETMTLGLLFALAGWVQMITAVWLAAGRGRAAVTVMSVTNVAALAGWVVSRTLGLPVIHPGVEAAGTADVLTAVLEVLAVVAAVTLVRGPRSNRAAQRAMPIGLVAAGLLALGASGAAVAALGSTGGHGHGEEVSAGADEGHGHAHGEEVAHASSEETGGGELSRQPGTLPAALHRHRPGVYHLHEDIDLHHHERGIVHVHTAPKSEPSPSGDGTTSGGGGSGDHHDGSDGHTH